MASQSTQCTSAGGTCGGFESKQCMCGTAQMLGVYENKCVGSTKKCYSGAMCTGSATNVCDAGSQKCKDSVKAVATAVLGLGVGILVVLIVIPIVVIVLLIICCYCCCCRKK